MERPSVPTIRPATAAPDPTGHARLRRYSIALAAIALALTVMGAIAPATAHAAPSVPAPEAAPADPPTPTTTPPTTTPPTTTPPTTVPGIEPSTTAALAPSAPTPVTAVVLADVATGAPPLVPQLASQGAVAAGGPASLVRSAPAQLPATGGVDRGLGLLAISLAGIGAALIGVARRRRPGVTGV